MPENKPFIPGPQVNIGSDWERGARLALAAAGIKNQKEQNEWMQKLYASQLQTEAMKRQQLGTQMQREAMPVSQFMGQGPQTMGDIPFYTQAQGLLNPPSKITPLHPGGAIAIQTPGQPGVQISQVPGQPTTALPNLGKLQQYKEQLLNSGLLPNDPKIAQVDEAIKKLTTTPEETNEYKDFMSEQIKRGIPKDQALKNWATLQEQRIGARGEAFAKTRGVSMYDLQTESFIEMPWNEITKANKEEPGRFIPATQALPTMQKQATMKEISVASTIARNALKGLKKDFDTTQRAQFAKVLNDPVPMSAWDAFIRGSVGATLTPDQVEYMRSILNLRESAFALRSVSGMGQGSDMLRQAIANAIPGAATFSKKEAISALDKFDTQVNILRTGIPGKEITSSPKGQVGPGMATIHFKEGNDEWDIPSDKVKAFKMAHPNAR